VKKGMSDHDDDDENDDISTEQFVYFIFKYLM